MCFSAYSVSSPHDNVDVKKDVRQRDLAYQKWLTSKLVTLKVQQNDREKEEQLHRLRTGPARNKPLLS